VSGRGQGRQPPKAGARSASLEPGRSLVYFNTVAPVIGLVVTVAGGKNIFHQLDASVEASGPHDFAVRVQHRSSALLPASIASRPASVTTANRPFGGDETVLVLK
jgi:hypothetical protein